jgi:hypothetical protein
MEHPLSSTRKSAQIDMISSATDCICGAERARIGHQTVTKPAVCLATATRVRVDRESIARGKWPLRVMRPGHRAVAA